MLNNSEYANASPAVRAAHVSERWEIFPDWCSNWMDNQSCVNIVSEASTMPCPPLQTAPMQIVMARSRSSQIQTKIAPVRFALRLDKEHSWCTIAVQCDYPRMDSRSQRLHTKSAFFQKFAAADEHGKTWQDERSKLLWKARWFRCRCTLFRCNSLSPNGLCAKPLGRQFHCAICFSAAFNAARTWSASSASDARSR